MIISEKVEIDDVETLELVAKTGIDGSGCHKVRHQIINTELSIDENPHLDPTIYSNYLLCCMSPLSLLKCRPDGEKIKIWENPSPNSIFYALPISLVRAKESRPVIEKEFDFLFSQIKADSTYSVRIKEQETICNSFHQT